MVLTVALTMVQIYIEQKILEAQNSRIPFKNICICEARYKAPSWPKYKLTLQSFILQNFKATQPYFVSISQIKY